MAMVALEGFGGGSALNFKVVGGISRPENTKENTIWANATVTDWVISANKPESPFDGLLWLQTGITGTEFNALKKGAIQIILKAAKVYEDDTLKQIDAEIYQNDRWIQFSKTWNGELYEPDNQYIEFTGGWSSDGWSGFGGVGTKAPIIDSSGITLLTDSTASFPLAGTVDKVDLRDFSTVYVTVDTLDTPIGAWVGINTNEKVVGIADNYVFAAKAEIKNTGEIELPCSGIDSGYIVVWVYGYGAAGKKLRVTRIRME